MKQTSLDRAVEFINTIPDAVKSIDAKEYDGLTRDEIVAAQEWLRRAEHELGAASMRCGNLAHDCTLLLEQLATEGATSF